MTLGVFLAIGESLTDLKNKGQLDRLLNYNIKKYSKSFDEVYLFSYRNETINLPDNCHLIANNKNINRYLYSLLMPIIHIKQIKECNVLRGLQLSGGIPASISKIFFGKNFVINYGYDYPKFAKIEGKPLQSLLYKLIQKPIVTLSSCVIVTSEEFKKTLSMIIHHNKIVLLPNGVDLGLFRPLKSYASKKRYRILYIGRLEKQKNLNQLILAVNHSKLNPEVIFYGEGSQKKYLMALAKTLKVRLKINPPVVYKEIPRIMSEFDVFALPSIEEGSPKILLEAMACGKTVMGSNVVGINNIIINDKNGLLTEPDFRSISKALIRLKNANLRKRLSLSAHLFIKNNFDINKFLAKEINLLKSFSQ